MAERTPRRRRGDTRVFVYGSLRRGQSNHRLLSTARFVGFDRTAARYTMVSLGAFPAVHAGGDTAIIGEVYDVTAATLAALDRLEGHPTFYRREVLVLASRCRAWTYLVPTERDAPRVIVAGGDWVLRTVVPGVDEPRAGERTR